MTASFDANADATVAERTELDLDVVRLDNKGSPRPPWRLEYFFGSQFAFRFPGGAELGDLFWSKESIWGDQHVLGVVLFLVAGRVRMVPGTTFYKPLDVSWHTKEVAQEGQNPGQFPTE